MRQIAALVILNGFILGAFSGSTPPVYAAESREADPHAEAEEAFRRGVTHLKNEEYDRWLGQNAAVPQLCRVQPVQFSQSAEMGRGRLDPQPP